MVDVITGVAGAPTEAGETPVLKAPYKVEVVAVPGLAIDVAPLVIARTLTTFTVPYEVVEKLFVTETVWVSIVPS